MAMDTSKLHLPKTVATAVVNKVKETSTIAALSPSSPQIFTDKEYMIFNGAAEADVTAEGQTKSSYEQDLNYVSGKTFKVQTTTRVTSELKWADEDNRFQIIQSIQADQAEAIGRALDYVVYHAINPKTGEPLTGFDALTARAMQVTAGDDDITNVDNLADQLNETYDINGIAISRTWASRLRKIRVPATGMRYYPEIPLNLQVGTLDGIKAAHQRHRQRGQGQDTHPRARHHGRFQPHQMGHGARHYVRDHPLRRPRPDRRRPQSPQPDRLPHRGHVLLRGHRTQGVRRAQVLHGSG